ncbi:phosphotransferase [Ornithinibacillus scapharcae]|uniref:phosphotransferase n=1 Tax=Ornithinibacillus scapharcae TaxID=1147159 RepID=UPI000225BE83|nr:phosphotransferase [Ornithinibacillus scapharcae]
MRNYLGRDDHRFNRLSSFLYWEGNLEAKKIHQIKRNVYYIETESGSKYILKGHSNAQNVKQQWEFFDRVHSSKIISFVRFPNGKREITTGTNYSWTLSPFVIGRKLNYESENDRKKAVETIKFFHEQANQVFVKNMVRKQLFYQRWMNRMERFKATKEIFEKYGYSYIYDEVMLMMKKYLDVVSDYPWYHDQIAAERNGSWVHGDIASHNFIQNESTYLIDFDLLQCTVQMYDYIQLGQRFLPSIEWDLDTLVSYNMVEDQNLERYLYSVFVPSDLLREWMHFLMKKRTISIEDYLQKMEIEWSQRKKFLHQVRKTIK